MEENNNIENEIVKENNNIVIEDEVIATIAGIAVSEVSGVAEMAGGFAGGITEVLSGKKNLAKGIKVETKEGETKIDVNIKLLKKVITENFPKVYKIIGKIISITEKVSFKDFADKNVRQRFIEVDEKDLYDTYYDYDTCFSHRYWGAIRESSLLICDNPAHNYHSVADTECEQKLVNCCNDLIFLLDKIISIMNDEIGVK